MRPSKVLFCRKIFGILVIRVAANDHTGDN